MTTSAYEQIRGLAIDRLDAAGVDPAGDAKAVAVAVSDAVARYEAGEHHGLRDTRHMVARIVASITAFGPLTDLLADEDVEEIFIEGDRVTYIGGGGALRSLADPVTEPETKHLVTRLIAAADRRLDAASPIVQARVLGDSARLTAVIPPVADRLSATIRRYALRRTTLDHLVELGSLSSPAADFLAAAMQASASILISGPPGAGKTSLLAALLVAVPAAQCVRCVEEVRELNVDLGPHSSFYEARPPGMDGGASVSVRDLVKLVLAMRPDRIVVGEVRGAEAFELTRASNAGCGFCCSVHANSARAALEALVNAALMAGENITERVVRKIFASTIDFVVHLDRDPVPLVGGGLRRRVVEILALRRDHGNEFVVETLFSRDGLEAPMAWTGALPPEEMTTRLETVAQASLRAMCAGRPA
ncbi:MAG: CpaF family protein [Acidimicrobiia bacterium]